MEVQILDRSDGLVYNFIATVELGHLIYLRKKKYRKKFFFNLGNKITQQLIWNVVHLSNRLIDEEPDNCSQILISPKDYVI